MDTNALIDELLQYAELDDTEPGEISKLICELLYHRENINSDLVISICDEAKDLLQEYKESARIIEVPTIVKKLEWIDEE